MSQLERYILLVNISGPELDLWGDFLNQWGYSWAAAGTGNGDQSVWAQRTYRLVLYRFSDFSEEEYQFLELVRSELGPVPVVAISAFVSVKDCFRMARAGVADYLGQPFQPPELKKVIEKHCFSFMAEVEVLL